MKALPDTTPDLRSQSALNAVKRRRPVNHHLSNPDELDAQADDLEPMGEIEYEEEDGIDTDVEVEMLVARMQATRFFGA
jgi:hypothetical protein